MAKERAGWERKLYRGTAGSTASDQVTKARDVNVATTHTRTSTKDRGDGSAIPKETEQVVGIGCSVTWTMNFDDGDADIAAFIARTIDGAAIAIKTERVVSGSYTSEFDGDVTVEMDFPGPLEAGMEVTFTGTPTKESARTWTLA